MRTSHSPGRDFQPPSNLNGSLPMKLRADEGSVLFVRHLEAAARLLDARKVSLSLQQTGQARRALSGIWAHLAPLFLGPAAPGVAARYDELVNGDD